MEDKILSVGIDIGTSTTQIIFSQITVQNTANSFLVPNIKITDIKIIYRSGIYFTPLISREKINLKKLKEIILKEYEMAGICKKNISTGAIIITGETAGKENAKEVLNVLSDLAGDFVVATAGPDLEAILAGYGAGACDISKNKAIKIINFDIGGGTTNCAVFSEGKVVDSFAFDIGGRLIQFDEEDKIIYISDKIKKLIYNLKLNLSIGEKPEFDDLKILTDVFAKVIFETFNNQDLSREEEKLFIQHKSKNMKSQFLMFSGGVSEFVYSSLKIDTLSDTLRFKDIGPVLGYSIRQIFKTQKDKLLQPKEKIRATVIGAGSHSIKISGSTIMFEDDILPVKSIPIVKIPMGEDEETESIYKNICSKSRMYKDTNWAIAFRGPKSPKYSQIKKIASAIVKAFSCSDNPIIVIIESDFAKALGQTIKNIDSNHKIVCIDNIEVTNGDYIDIGKSISGVVPVVIKTLIFKG
ncbi:ethanolamine ammonia-lyase reactivating factor EutA [Clostridium sp. Mt-5]|uniref:Ethanolamine ammonia-lyase reactivating factor EutA n=1 Tax=Clostridium moutaii TaxID=3240932 RepID=A0ABV4BP73_9CLOT